MGLEVATLISQLVATNPLANDKKNQGDDHLRLLKLVLQTNFPNADRAFRFPEVISKNGAYTILEADDNKTILCDTTAAFNLTLPTPTYDGWLVRVVKFSYDLNPVYVLPPSGSIGTPAGNIAKVRVNVPTVEHIFLWTGASFIRLTGVGENAAGILVDCGGNVPVGYEAATGQSLIRADYPETFLVWGTVHGSASGAHFSAPNMFDQFAVGAGATYPLGQRAGQASHTIGQSNLPAVTLATTIAAGQGSHQHPTQTGANSGLTASAGLSSNTPQYVQAGTANTSDATLPAMSGTTPLGGSGVAISHVPPYLAVNKVFRKC